jgi:hypothetical protein
MSRSGEWCDAHLHVTMTLELLFITAAQIFPELQLFKHVRWIAPIPQHLHPPVTQVK